MKSLCFNISLFVSYHHVGSKNCLLTFIFQISDFLDSTQWFMMDERSNLFAVYATKPLTPFLKRQDSQSVVKLPSYTPVLSPFLTLLLTLYFGCVQETVKCFSPHVLQIDVVRLGPSC